MDSLLTWRKSWLTVSWGICTSAEHVHSENTGDIPFEVENTKSNKFNQCK